MPLAIPMAPPDMGVSLSFRPGYCSFSTAETCSRSPRRSADDRYGAPASVRASEEDAVNCFTFTNDFLSRAEAMPKKMRE